METKISKKINVPIFKPDVQNHYFYPCDRI